MMSTTSRAPESKRFSIPSHLQSLLWCMAFPVFVLHGQISSAQSVSISPGVAIVATGGTVQYTATVTGLANQSVTWSVSGWNLQNGSINSNGLYTAPSSVPAQKITITARASNLLTSGSVTVNVLAKGPNITGISPNPLVTGSYTATVSGSGFAAGVAVFANGNAVTSTYINATTLSISGTQSTSGPVAFRAQNANSMPGATFTATFHDPPSVAPTTANVVLGRSLQFSSANATSWTASAGSITNTGLYTAPGTMPGSSAVTITATGPYGSATAHVTLVPPPTISPSAASIALGSTLQFTSAGATSWVASAGSINSSGLYTAPVTMPSSNQVTVTATGPNGSASANVSLYAPQTISPATVTLALGKTQQFTSAGATSWTASAGSISTSGLYTAPATMPSSNQVTVTATGPNGSASAKVTLQAAQSISPTTVTLALGATQQFTSAGATSWTATAGTITSAGFYTAPSSLPGSATVTVTASGPGGSASATVTLASSAVQIKSVGSGQIPLGFFTVPITGTGFTANAAVQINGSTVPSSYANGTLTASGFYGVAGAANVTVTVGSNTSAPFPIQVGVPNPLASAAAARRFLEQAAFGPTASDAAHVQTVGMRGWITEQFNMSQQSNYDSITASESGMPNHFMTMAVTNQDQLRQRVAFALNQIFVVSDIKLVFNTNLIPYQDMLLADSFSNFRTIMEDVTLSPAMGQYLDMANNAKADPSIDSAANENYARELMQLFTIGTSLLNQDGSVQVDSNGLPLPSYTQFTVTEFARVFTGWTYPPAPGNPVKWGGGPWVYYGPMVPYDAEHDFGSKQLLDGVVSPAGATTQQDMETALDSIFNHPNVGPFIAKQLIQHLVKSNPSPAYISRVAAAFNNNGNNVRGDMKAVITAVLLDTEARANDAGGKEMSSDGHLQEPALFIAGMVRAFNGQMNDQNPYATDLGYQGEYVFNSPSVFNFYAPGFTLPGSSLTGGEFQIYTPDASILRANEIYSLMMKQTTFVQNNVAGTSIDLTPYVNIASNPSTLVDALDLALTHGTMPAPMKSQIVNAVTADTGTALHKVQMASFLILSSSFYNVWH